MSQAPLPPPTQHMRVATARAASTTLLVASLRDPTGAGAAAAAPISCVVNTTDHHWLLDNKFFTTKSPEAWQPPDINSCPASSCHADVYTAPYDLLINITSPLHSTTKYNIPRHLLPCYLGRMSAILCVTKTFVHSLTHLDLFILPNNGTWHSYYKLDHSQINSYLLIYQK